MGFATRCELQGPDALRLEVAASPFGAELTPTIFHEPWWLEMSCDGSYREATVSSGGRVVGRLPYLCSKTRLGMRFLRIPAMTHVLGPALLQEVAGSNYPNAVKQISITRDLIAQLPKAAHIWFRLHGGVTNTLPFNAAGFSTSVDFTVVVPPEPQDVMWRRMNGKTRNVIRRSQERLSVGESLDAGAFMDFYEANLRERGQDSHYDRPTCTNIINESFRRGVGRVLTVSDPAGNPRSALFTVWDHQTEYYLMSTRSLDSMNGATSLAIWATLEHAGRKGLAFDMAGLHVHHNHIPNLRLLTSFGGAIAPRYVVRRMSPAVQLAKSMLRLMPRPSAKASAAEARRDQAAA